MDQANDTTINPTREDAYWQRESEALEATRAAWNRAADEAPAC